MIKWVMERFLRLSCCFLSCCFLACGFLLLAFGLPLSAQTSAPHSAPSYAGCLEKDHLRHWTHFPLRVYFLPGLLPPERLKQVFAGFDEWVSATGGTVCYQVVSVEDGADISVSVSSQLSLPKDARALGQTVLTFDGPVMTKAVLQLVEREDNPAQFQEICAHEFGHALGIDGHSDDPRDMMYPVLSHSLLQAGNPEIDCFCTPGSVTPRDIGTLAAAYPALHFVCKNH